MTEEYILYLIALLKIPKVGPINAKTLIAYCGSPKAIFKKSKKELLTIPGIGQVVASNIINGDTLPIAEKEIQFVEKNNIKISTYLDDSFPKRLLHHNDSPLLLFHKGTGDLNYPRTVGIVGTRKPTAYGKIETEKMVEGLLGYDVQIVSGLAFGIDAAAHTAAVLKGAETLGILGHSLDRIYPAQHRKLALQMIEHGGVVSEFTSGTKPDPQNFPMRNRIIAGMCDVIIVMESKRSGGSIITAEIANAYNKDVFALPGRTTDEQSAGTNSLIKQNKAHLIESAEDIGYIMRWDKERTGNNQLPLFLDLSDVQRKVYDMIKNQNDEVSFDHLHHNCDMPISELSSTLLTLEFDGLIKTLPGKMYIAF